MEERKPPFLFSTNSSLRRNPSRSRLVLFSRHLWKREDPMLPFAEDARPNGVKELMTFTPFSPVRHQTTTPYQSLRGS
ncbi:hypothetical protein RND71_018822 [Anisodus tanguticus]|uniref:Uncharacterized protein n=1 Tax=Anisodus tanguticus TaxID=243964 RepID=A0AAE1VH88_9SOLA|nr:hypothetical protein RND71_018822 [Anisodus tanguticus]